MLQLNYQHWLTDWPCSLLRCDAFFSSFLFPWVKCVQLRLTCRSKDVTYHLQKYAVNSILKQRLTVPFPATSNVWFLIQFCKMIISPGVFLIFFKILIFQVVREIKGQKTVQNDKKILSAALNISGSIHHMIVI